MTNFVNDFITKISDLNKKEMIKEIIDGQKIILGFGYIPIYICDGNENCMRVVSYEQQSCDLCNKHYCDICSHDHKFCGFCDTRFCDTCSHDIGFVDFIDGSSCQLGDCPARTYSGIKY